MKRTKSLVASILGTTVTGIQVIATFYVIFLYMSLISQVTDPEAKSLVVMMIGIAVVLELFLITSLVLSCVTFGHVNGSPRKVWKEKGCNNRNYRIQFLGCNHVYCILLWIWCWNNCFRFDLCRCTCCCQCFVYHGLDTRKSKSWKIQQRTRKSNYRTSQSWSSKNWRSKSCCRNNSRNKRRKIKRGTLLLFYSNFQKWRILWKEQKLWLLKFCHLYVN